MARTISDTRIFKTLNRAVEDKGIAYAAYMCGYKDTPGLRNIIKTERIPSIRRDLIVKFIRAYQPVGRKKKTTTSSK